MLHLRRQLLLIWTPCRCPRLRQGARQACEQSMRMRNGNSETFPEAINWSLRGLGRLSGCEAQGILAVAHWIAYLKGRWLLWVTSLRHVSAVLAHSLIVCDFLLR